MKKYYVDMQYQNQPKNKAEADVQSFARDLNGTLIHGEENLQRFVEQFKIRVEEINLHYPRCKDISTNFRRYDDHNSMWVSASDVTRIDFKEVKHEFPEQPTNRALLIDFVKSGCITEYWKENKKLEIEQIDIYLSTKKQP